MRLGELVDIVAGQLRGDASLEVTGIAGLDDATTGDLSYIVDSKFIDNAAGSNAAAFLVPEFFDGIDRPQLKVSDPQLAFAGLLESMRPRPDYPVGISDIAFVDPSADIAPDVSIMPHAYVSAGVSIGAGSAVGAGVFIGEGTKVGQDCLIHPNVSLMDGVSIGNRVIIHSGTVIGSDGYGYLQRGGRHLKIPQVGGVIVEDDVEIGANCAIDRANTANTVIGAGSKLDNLVHVAHNVTIGEGSLLTAMVGIAGSTKIGKHVVLAGQVGVKDHVEIADNVVVVAKSAVMTDLKKSGMYGGMPAFPIQGWLRSSKAFEKLPELIKTVRRLQKRLDELENPDNKE